MAGTTIARAGAPKDEISVDLATEIDKVAGIPERFAVEVPYRFGVRSHGTWTATGNARTWSYVVSVPGAVSLSFHAGPVVLPSGATLIVSGGGSEYRYASRDVHRGELWSRIARGNTLTFTLTAGAADANAVVLDVVGLQAGFRSLGKGGPNNAHFDEIQRRVKASASATTCIENYQCHITPTNQGPGQSSVTLVIANLGLCSGVLLNDVPGDGTPYVLTARHCENGNSDGGDPSAASGVTAYFDAITPCGEALGTVYDTSTAAITGAVTMVEQQDAWLLRLDNPPPVTDAYFAGWDATGAGFIGGYTAHYGLGNARQFAGWYGQAYYAQVSAATLGVHYASTFWELVNQVGSIAPGASGSGVFDANNRLVGTIVRGESQSTQTDSPGVCPVLAPPVPSPTTATAFATAFSGIFDSTADPQSTTGAVTLRTVLDPQDSGALTLNGSWLPPQLSASSPTSPTGSLVTLTWSAPGSTSCTASGGLLGDGWSGSLAASGSLTVTEYNGGAVTYALACNSASLQSTARVTVTWSLATPTATIQVSSGSNGFVSSPIQLTWVSTVTPCTATGGNAGDGWTGALGGRGTRTVTESTAGTYTYVLACGSGSRSASAQVQVTFIAPAATLQDGGITSVNIGLPVTLIGTGTGTSCATSGGSSGDGWAGLNFLSVGEVYSVTETTPGTYTYTFTCSAGSITASSSVTVTFSNGPPAVTLSTTPNAPTVTNSFLHVSWVASVAPCTLTVSGNSGYTLSNFSYVGYHDDSQNVIGPYTYTVTCGAGSGTASASTTVNWVGTPQLTLTAGYSPLVLGTPESVSWSGNVSPCVASGGHPGDGWTGTSTAAVGFLPVTEAQPGTYTYSLVCGTGTKTAQAQTTLTINPGPVFATLTASAPSAPEGGTPVTLTWNSNTSPCLQIGDSGNGGWHNSIASSGTASITEDLPGPHTYIIQCGSGGLATLATAQVIVTFTGPPQPTFTASTNSANVGIPFSLSWASADGSTCNATLGAPGDGWAGPRPASGTTQITELTPGPYAYEIKCGIAAVSLLGVEVNPAPFVPQPPVPAIVQLTFSATQTFPNQSVTLSWTTSGVTACMASGGGGTDGWQGSIPTTGSQTILETTSGSYTFSISCNGGGTVTGQAVLVVNPAPTAVLTASAPKVDAGQSFTLTWNSTETSNCTAKGGTSGDGWSGPEATSGNVSVTEAATGSYTYTVSCTAGPETVQAIAEVVVIASSTGGSGHSGGGGALDSLSLTALGLLVAVRRRRGLLCAR
jgi:hypothetical protein